MCTLLVKQIPNPVYTMQFIINTHWYGAAEIGLWRAQLEGLLHLKQNSIPLRHLLQPALALISLTCTSQQGRLGTHTSCQPLSPSDFKPITSWRSLRLKISSAFLPALNYLLPFTAKLAMEDGFKNTLSNYFLFQLLWNISSGSVQF